MNRLLPLVMVPAVACVNANVDRKDSGVAVGNPGEMTARVSRDGDLETTEGWGYFAAVTVTDCDERVQDVATDIAFDLAGDPTLLLPPGDWCGLTAEGGQLVLTAESSSRQVSLEVELDDVEVGAEDGFTIASGGYVLQLGPDGWLSEAELELEEPVTVIDDEDERSDEVRRLLAEESVMVEDADGDRERGDDEAVVAAGEEAEEQAPEGDEDDEDGPHEEGCGGGAAGLGLPLALLALGWRRRSPWGPPRR